MGAVARAEFVEKSARKPRARGFRVVQMGHAGVDPHAQRKLLAALQTPHGRTHAVAQAEASLSAAHDLEPYEPWWCNDCSKSSKECECPPDSLDD